PPACPPRPKRWWPTERRARGGCHMRSVRSSAHGIVVGFVWFIIGKHAHRRRPVILVLARTYRPHEGDQEEPGHEGACGDQEEDDGHGLLQCASKADILMTLA